MLEYVTNQRKAREYDEFVQRKVAAGRASVHSGLGIANDEVEAGFAAQRSVAKKRV